MHDTFCHPSILHVNQKMNECDMSVTYKYTKNVYCYSILEQQQQQQHNSNLTCKMLRRNALLLTATALPTRMKNKLSSGKRATAHVVLAPNCILYKNFNNNNSSQMMMMTMMMRGRVGVLSTTPASTSCENKLLLLDHTHHGHDHHCNGLGKRDWDKLPTVFKRDSWSSYPTQRHMYFNMPTLKEWHRQLRCWESAGVALAGQAETEKVGSSCCLPSSEAVVVMTSTVYGHIPPDSFQ